MSSKKKIASAEAFSARLEEVVEQYGSDRIGLLRSHWDHGRGINLFDLEEDDWAFFVTELPPLVAADVAFGKPQLIHGRSLWNMVNANRMESLVRNNMEELARDFGNFMEDDWHEIYGDRSDYVGRMELYIAAYRRLGEYAAALKAAGVKEYPLALTDQGMSAADIKRLEKLLAEAQAKVEAIRNPPPKEPLFDAPKKGKYPAFDDEAYADYLRELQSTFYDGLQALRGSGIPLSGDPAERMLENLETFDYGEIRATLGAQKRWPDESVEEIYESLATLPEDIGKNFRTVAEEIDESAASFARTVKEGDRTSCMMAFLSLKQEKKTLGWLVNAFPGVESALMTQAMNAITKAHDDYWTRISGGPLHEKHAGEILFTSTRALPVSEDDIPDTLNPVKEPVYAHVLLKDTWRNLMSGEMMFFYFGDERILFNADAIPEPDSAYLCLELFPDEKTGRNPELIRFAGGVMAAADGEIRAAANDVGRDTAVGTLKLKMSKADAGKLAARTEKLAAAADANRTAEAVLPEVFTKARKTWYKDKLLSKEKVIAAITEAWERNHGQSIKVLALCLNHYRGPGHEWDVERNGLNQPIARLAFSYVGMVYECDGETFCVEDGIQFRQFHTPDAGYGEELNVLLWCGKPFKLPPAQVKRLVK